MKIIDVIIRLTCVSWKFILAMPMFPHSDTMKTRLTYYYIGILSNMRLIPTGSLIIWAGWAQKYAHPP
jgi:hypothetical protein